MARGDAPRLPAPINGSEEYLAALYILATATAEDLAVIRSDLHQLVELMQEPAASRADPEVFQERAVRAIPPSAAPPDTPDPPTRVEKPEPAKSTQSSAHKPVAKK